MEQQRLVEIQRHAAATLIQQAWRKFQFNQKHMLEIYDDQEGYKHFRKNFQVLTTLKDTALRVLLP